jgi:LysM domain
MPEIESTYEVMPGDTLSRIAQAHGIPLQALLAANQQIDNPDLIFVGQKISIPSAEEPTTTPAPPPAPTGAPPTAPTHPTFDGIHPAPGTVSTSRANYVHPPLTDQPGQRDADVYAQVINQFAVGNNPRYLAGGGNTYCNIFVWDVTRAMGAEIPHWIDAAGNIAAPGAPHASEITINGGVIWMENHGVPQRGWRQVTPQEAQDAANAGSVAVVMWKNPTGGHGHTAVIRPGSINSKGPASAQAGAINFNAGHVADGFGHLFNSAHLLYFSHD